MNRASQIWLFCLHFLVYYLPAQTTLFPGDLAVISVNANNGACSGVSGEDQISIVFFKDIAPGTAIDITDNGWERLNPGFFGNSEGVYRLTRTGPMIPAGTVVTFVLPAIGGQARFSAPDDLWDITRLNAQNVNVNLNASGDQLFFFQGGVWEDGDTGFGGNQENAQYTGGRLLFAFNTQTEWQPFQDNSGNSGLPEALIPCFFMNPSTAASDFLYYNGPATATTQLEWIIRISDPANWAAVPGCGAFPIPPATFAVDTEGIGLNCTTCQDCASFEETLTFQLPLESGPFDLLFSINEDTIALNNYDGITPYAFPVDGPTTVRLISVQDNRGCALQIPDSLLLDLQPGIGINVTNPAVQVACNLGNGTGSFDLTALSDSLRTVPTDTVLWFADTSRNQAIDAGTNFQSDSRTIFAEVRNGLCTAGLIPVSLRVDPVPQLSAAGGSAICPGSCHQIDLRFSGSGPFTLQYELLIGGNWQPLLVSTAQSDTSLTICPDIGVASAIRFVRLIDQVCFTDLTTQFSLPTLDSAILRVQDTLCFGDSLVVHGETYHANRPSGQDTLFGAGRGGCDSLIIVELTFISSTDLSVTLSGDTAICRGQTATVDLDVPDDQPYDLTYRIDGGQEVLLSNVIESTSVPIATETDVRLTVTSIVPSAGGCRQPLDASWDIRVTDLSAQIITLEQPGCTDTNSGRLGINTIGGMPPFTYRWSGGQTVAEVADLGPGSYGATVTDAAGCQVPLAVVLQAPQPLDADITEDPAECPGENSRLIINRVSGGQGAYQYTFNGSDYSPIPQLPLVIDQPPLDADLLQLRDGTDCQLDIPLTPLSALPELNITLEPQVVIVEGDSIRLSPAFSFSPQRITWTDDPSLQLRDGGQSAIAAPRQTTVYRITATAQGGCVVSTTVRVIVEERERTFFAPTGFSPNNDGQNDYFTLFGGPDLRQIAVLRVFNRWGAIVFEGFNLSPGVPEEGWDGSKGIEDQPSGIYLFQAELLLTNGDRIPVSGDVFLMR